MKKLLRSQERNLQQDTNQDGVYRHNGKEMNPYQQLGHKEFSSPVGDGTDQSGYKELQVAEFNQDESGGEPSVIDMTEDEIGMDAHDV